MSALPQLSLNPLSLASRPAGAANWWGSNAFEIEKGVNERARINMTTYNSLAALLASANASFARAGAGYALNSSGVYEAFASGEIRQTDMGILIESARSDELTRSADLIQTDWSAEAGTTKSALSGGPIEGEDATRFTWSSGNGRVGQLFTWVNGENKHVIGIGRRASASRYLIFRLEGSGSFRNYTFDLQTGTVYSAAFDASGTNAYIEELSDGYYVCGFDLAVSVNTTSNAYVYINDVAPANATGFAAPVALDYYDIAYFDLIDGTGRCAPIVSGASVASRAADALTIFPAADTYDLTFTFDDDSTQAANGEVIGGGGYVVPTNLDRRYIKNIAGVEA